MVRMRSRVRVPSSAPRRGKFRDFKALAKARAFSCSTAAPFPRRTHFANAPFEFSGGPILSASILYQRHTSEQSLLCSVFLCKKNFTRALVPAVHTFRLLNALRLERQASFSPTNPLRCSGPFPFKLRCSRFHGRPLHRRCLPNRRFGQRSCSRPFPFKLRYSRFHGRPLHRRCLPNRRFGQRSIAALGSRGAQLYLQRFCMNNARRGVQRACLPALRCRAAAHQPFYRQQKSLPLRRNRKGRLCAAMFGGLPRIKC